MAARGNIRSGTLSDKIIWQSSRQNPVYNESDPRSLEIWFHYMTPLLNEKELLEIANEPNPADLSSTEWATEHADTLAAIIADGLPHDLALRKGYNLYCRKARAASLLIAETTSVTHGEHTHAR